MIQRPTQRRNRRPDSDLGEHDRAPYVTQGGASVRTRIGSDSELAIGAGRSQAGDLLVKVDDAMKQPLSPGEIKRGASRSSPGRWIP